MYKQRLNDVFQLIGGILNRIVSSFETGYIKLKFQTFRMKFTVRFDYKCSLDLINELKISEFVEKVGLEMFQNYQRDIVLSIYSIIPAQKYIVPY